MENTLVVVDLLFQDADMCNANEQSGFLSGAFVLDCKALVDGISRIGSSALGLSDKRSAPEAIALKITLSATTNTSALAM